MDNKFPNPNDVCYPFGMEKTISNAVKWSCLSTFYANEYFRLILLLRQQREYFNAVYIYRNHSGYTSRAIDVMRETTSKMVRLLKATEDWIATKDNKYFDFDPMRFRVWCLTHGLMTSDWLSLPNKRRK